MAQPVFDNNTACLKIYNEMFLLHFNNVNALIEKEEKNNPTNVYVYSLEGYAGFIEAFLSEREDLFKTYKTETDKRLEKLRSGDKSSPYYLMTQAELILQRALLRARFREYFNAAIDIRKSYKMMVENQAKFPGFKPNLKTLGLMHSVIGSVPQNFQWVVKLIGMHGTIKQGTAELHQLLNASRTDRSISYMKNEILLYLIFVESHLTKNKSVSLQLLNEYDKNNSSQLITFSHVNTYYTFDKNEQVIQLLNERKSDSQAFHMFYLDYLHAIAKLNRLDEDADVYFKKYTSGFTGSSFIKSSYQKSAWHALVVKKDKSLYEMYMKNCIVKGDDFSDEDKQALKEAQSKEIPNYYLLRARLLFDGGYYQKALNEIVSKSKDDFPNVKDKLELIYRLARIFDKMENNEKAIDMYKKTVELGTDKQFYYAANAALNLGIIYEQQGDLKNAESWYRKCLSMRNHDYQNSIDQKAKAGLDRLGKE